MGYNDIFMQIVAAGRIPPPPSAVANYLPFRIVGNQLLLSGQAPFFGPALKWTGKVGDTVSIQDGTTAARLTGINLLYVAQQALGTLDRVVNVIEVEGMVNCTPDFTQQSAVIDGCSDLLVEVFGSVHGKHVRSAAGHVALAFDITVEIKMSLEVAV
jgi:enamine deaminase RidA (YjgF/YER057c/UK114 family)